MKKLLVAALCLTSFVAKAELVPVPKDKINDYKVAVSQALRKTDFTCTSTYSLDYINDTVNGATSVSIENSNSQPSIVITNTIGSYRTLLNVKISNDNMSILSVEYYRQDNLPINIGTINNPKIENQWTSRSTGDICIAQPK